MGATASLSLNAVADLPTAPTCSATMATSCQYRYGLIPLYAPPSAVVECVPSSVWKAGRFPR